jgi:hypothetical protein
VIVATQARARAEGALARGRWATRTRSSRAPRTTTGSRRRGGTEKKDELEIYVDARKAIESLKLPKAWPDAKSQDFATGDARAGVPARSLKDAIGVLGVDEGIALDLHGELSSEQITPEQVRLYRTRGVERDALLGAIARIAPRDSALVVYLHAPVADF